MDNGTQQSKKISGRHEVLLIAVAFALWAVMFRDYLTSKVAIFDDAVSYYDHIKFLSDSLRRGVFPLWDPYWYCGTANHFFLQRMGVFNPFLHLTNIFHAVGIPYTIAYLMYLASYYFLGCIGFYLLAKRVLNDQFSALVAFLLLLFSALGTRIFDSYMILMFTPFAWFFYLFIAFSQAPRRSLFAGMTFTVAVAFTTYIPFYIIMLFSSFLFFYALLYWNTLPDILRRYAAFVSRNKILVAVCAVVLFASLVPGYMFFKEAGSRGEFSMPARNTNQALGVLGVRSQDFSNGWALLEELYFAGHYYADMTQIQFAVLYIPLLAYIIFLLGVFTRANRKLLLLFLWGMSLTLLCIPFASPVYNFLYQHIFFFKYFRNLHFLLWVALLPMLCLFLGEQIRLLMAWRPESKLEKLAVAAFLTAVHAGLGWFMLKNNFALVTSFFVLVLSYAFFLWRIFGTGRGSGKLAMFLFLVIVVIEPFEVYTYLSQNSKPYSKYVYSYDFIDPEFRYTRIDDNVDVAFFTPAEPSVEPKNQPRKRNVRPVGTIYYASRPYTQLAGSIDFDILRKYRKHRFILYDRVERINETDFDPVAFETFLAENRNVAHASTSDPGVLGVKSSARHSYYAQPLEEDSQAFQVTAFDANHVKIKTDLPEPKFLVYNDSYNSKWRVFIDGRPANMVRTNIAFKGVWIPEGPHTVEFSFAAGLRVVYILIFILINGLFVAALFFRRRESKGKPHERKI